MIIIPCIHFVVKSRETEGASKANGYYLPKPPMKFSTLRIGSGAIPVWEVSEAERSHNEQNKTEGSRFRHRCCIYGQSWKLVAAGVFLGGDLHNARCARSQHRYG